MMNPDYIIFICLLIFSLVLLTAVICIRFINLPSLIFGKKNTEEKRRV